MAKLVYGMNVSLDGYVDHMKFGPDAGLFAHFIAVIRDAAGCLYGRTLYQIMSYWDEDQPGWGAPERAFAAAWRGQRKWVVSRTLTAVGPNATLVAGDLGTAVRRLRDEADGIIEVGGPVLAQTLSEMGLIDEYRLYLHPVVLGGGAPFFRGALPRLRLTGSDRIGAEAICLTYVPA